MNKFIKFLNCLILFVIIISHYYISSKIDMEIPNIYNLLIHILISLSMIYIICLTFKYLETKFKYFLIFMYIIEMILESSIFLSPTLNDMVVYNTSFLYLVGGVRVITLISTIVISFYLIEKSKKYILVSIILILKQLLYYLEIVYSINLMLTMIIAVNLILIEILGIKTKEKIENDK